MSIDSTRIRYFSSKDVDLLIQAVNSLPFKVEIKGNPVLKKSKWFLFFVLPESEAPQFRKFQSLDLDQ